MKTRLFNFQNQALLAALVLSLAVFSAGCKKETDKGGPGGSATGPGTANTEGAAANTFQLTMPSGEVDITQGSSDKVTIGIERGDNFKQAVTLELMAPVKGVTLNPAKSTFAADKDEVEVEIDVAANAPIGETSVTVIGKPKTGESVNGAIKIQINEK